MDKSSVVAELVRSIAAGSAPFGLGPSHLAWHQGIRKAYKSFNSQLILLEQMVKQNMVPEEPISLSISIATLFTACIECFEYFKAAKGFEQHFEVLLIKLECQQERLLVWGDLAGICNEKQHSVGPISESGHKRQDLTKRCLDSIHRLLKDTETLRTKYGLRAYTPASDTPHIQVSVPMRSNGFAFDWVVNPKDPAS